MGQDGTLTAIAHLRRLVHLLIVQQGEDETDQLTGGEHSSTPVFVFEGFVEAALAPLPLHSYYMRRKEMRRLAASIVLGLVVMVLPVGCGRSAQGSWRLELQCQRFVQPLREMQATIPFNVGEDNTLSGEGTFRARIEVSGSSMTAEGRVKIAGRYVKGGFDFEELGFPNIKVREGSSSMARAVLGQFISEWGMREAIEDHLETYANPTTKLFENLQAEIKARDGAEASWGSCRMVLHQE